MLIQLYCKLLTAFLSTMLGLKESTRRASMVIDSPVWGLRPRRFAFCFTSKLPKPDILSFSPDTKVVFRMLKIDSNISADSVLVNPVVIWILSARSALVIIPSQKHVV